MSDWWRCADLTAWEHVVAAVERERQRAASTYSAATLQAAAAEAERLVALSHLQEAECAVAAAGAAVAAAEDEGGDPRSLYEPAVHAAYEVLLGLGETTPPTDATRSMIEDAAYDAAAAVARRWQSGEEPPV
jgi:hypothetical protein